MIRVLWTPLALDDLKGISIYIEGVRDLSTVNRVCRILYEAVQFLRRFPECGRLGIEEGTREWVVPSMPSYIVVYRITHTEAVQIMRIWHGAQQRFE